MVPLGGRHLARGRRHHRPRPGPGGRRDTLTGPRRGRAAPHPTAPPSPRRTDPPGRRSAGRPGGRPPRTAPASHEVGPVIRTIQPLRHLTDPQMRPRVNASTNKVEESNGSSRRR
ncbi:Tn3 family transposase [Kitasatospora sp. NPDC088346]|uniref:Tn3 family transposase n=1 Tax=Kitasatospora sp. NPDC088346 TaxID=3364073 RepID=UPI0037F4ADDC